jgi:hypothetical protein
MRRAAAPYTSTTAGTPHQLLEDSKVRVMWRVTSTDTQPMVHIIKITERE